MQSSYKGQIELTIILVKSPSDSGGATACATKSLPWEFLKR